MGGEESDMIPPIFKQSRSNLTGWPQEFCKKCHAFPEWILPVFIAWTRRSRRDLSMKISFIKIVLANLLIFLIGKLLILTIIPGHLTTLVHGLFILVGCAPKR
jgi:hypothetical protein